MSKLVFAKNVHSKHKPFIYRGVVLYVTSFNFFVMYVFCSSQSTTGDIILPKTLFAKVQNVHVKKGSGYKQCFFIVIMNSIVRYIMRAQCRWYNEIVVPNCKKRVAGENLLFHLEFASDCKTYSHTTLPQLKYTCKLNTAQVSLVKRFSSLGNLILEVSFIFHRFFMSDT